MAAGLRHPGLLPRHRGRPRLSAARSDRLTGTHGRHADVTLVASRCVDRLTVRGRSAKRHEPCPRRDGRTGDPARCSMFLEVTRNEPRRSGRRAGTWGASGRSPSSIRSRGIRRPVAGRRAASRTTERGGIRLTSLDRRSAGRLRDAEPEAASLVPGRSRSACRRRDAAMHGRAKPHRARPGCEDALREEDRGARSCSTWDWPSHRSTSAFEPTDPELLSVLRSCGRPVPASSRTTRP